MYCIWTELNINGDIIRSRSAKEYVRKGYAERMAKQITDMWAAAGHQAKCIVAGATSDDNPWKEEEADA